MKIIKSLEALLYELMVWLVFYPLTLFRALVHPLKLMDYADDELDDADEDRYSDALSPPIFLAISLGLVHLVELAGIWNIVTEGLLADDTNLIAFRVVAFSLYPLMLSLRLLRARKVQLDRKTLRLPFYAQCFVAAPFALAMDAATLFLAADLGWQVGFGTMLAGILWYLAVQTIWFRRELRSGWLRGFGNALRGFFEATFICLVLVTVVDQL